jgi:alanine racemase
MDLRPALVSVTSRLTQVKVTERRDYTAVSPIPLGRPVRLGVIPMGSSDGLMGFSVGHVLVRGRRARVLAISLEHTRLDLTGIDDAEAGDEVVIVGAQGSDEISIREVRLAHDLPTTAAVPCLVGSRVERRYTGKARDPVAMSLSRADV